jgi:hypothetical protein
MRALMASFLICLAAVPVPGHACKCAQTTPEAQFDRAPIVFIARITQVEDIAQEALWRLAQRHGQDDEWEPEEGIDYGLRMRFEVEMPIKGDPGRLTTLVTGYGSGDCGMAILPGGTLLVATDRDGHLQRCGLTAEFALRDCLGVLQLERLRERASDGKTVLGVPDAADVADEGMDLFEDVVRSGRNPYTLSSAECPLELKSAPVPDRGDASQDDRA